MWRALLLVALCACGRVGFSDLASGDANDAAVSTNPFFDDKGVPAPLGSARLELESFSYNSDTDTLIASISGMTVPHASVIDTSRGSSVRVLSFVGFEVRAALTIGGSLPVAIVADTIDISATIVVNAGARMCGATAGELSKGSTSSGGGGGGGGGSFGAAGGNGGNGNSDGTAAMGGTASLMPSALSLVGGCDGAAGGNGPGADLGGVGGSGGGGLVLQAATAITISSTIRAHGHGGAGGAYVSGQFGDAGGGGGGSGGLIALVAPRLTLTGATLAANGGAGGEGSLNGTPGSDGADGFDSDTAATSGNANGFPEDNGGDGGHRSSPAGATAPIGAIGGGGGGGGSVGRIILSDLGPAATAVISPAPTAL